MDSVFSFLSDLNLNNNRDWFNTNKKRYQDSLGLFKDLGDSVIEGISRFDPTIAGMEAKDTIFRIYKDVRFSKDKTPYKTHFGCWMAKGGRKSNDAGYYFHMEPGKSFMAAGVWMPPKEHLKLIRQEIMYNPAEYFKIIHAPAVIKAYERGGTEDMLKKGPVGFPKDFEHLDEIKFKHYILSKQYSDKEILSSGFSAKLIKNYKELAPLVHYLNHAMSFTGNE